MQGNLPTIKFRDKQVSDWIAYRENAEQESSIGLAWSAA